jgi:ABC-type branched-subunit amino acid transport system permease subunit
MKHSYFTIPGFNYTNVIIPVQDEMKRPANMLIAVPTAMIVVIFVYFVVGICGVLAAGEANLLVADDVYAAIARRASKVYNPDHAEELHTAISVIIIGLAGSILMNLIVSYPLVRRRDVLIS